MPAVYDKHGIYFLYPENWSVEEIDEFGEEETPDEGPEERLEEHQCMQVIAYSPETAFWQLSHYPADTDLEGLFDEALAAMRREYPEMETEPAAEMINSQRLEGYDVHFFCLELTNTAWIRGYRTAESTFLLLCQAEDRELIQTGPVFRAMWTSLLGGPCVQPKNQSSRDFS